MCPSHRDPDDAPAPHVRDATREDLPAILEIYNDAVLHTTASYDDRPSTLDARLAWFDARRDQNLPVLVAESADEVLGWASYGPFRAWPGYRYTVEHSVYVSREARGRGVGGVLLAELVSRARAQDLHAMVGGVDAANEASLRLHARHGFERVAHFRQVGRKFGRWLDLVFVELLLDDRERD
ncbi:GNAT family N-acetyltransferase [Deinococcus pimensis]|uniref:GNAT family N-acetyltransferase n=1 Tax=Deinococcus pimensis TaxID=309888 RepID=UPI0004AEFE6F|nr:GNAT family N-acetyltransferase [Deinococcus pimensis]